MQVPPKSKRRYYTLKEASEILGWTQGTIKKLLYAERLDGKKENNIYRITKRSVRALEQINPVMWAISTDFAVTIARAHKKYRYTEDGIRHVFEGSMDIVMERQPNQYLPMDFEHSQDAARLKKMIKKG